ncbi:EF-hand domain-containing protein [Rhodanobacter hydrolyticus]|uniref:EF-hand domain-containing protein n=1 Tax=Rhodanobacter hydrolyticus TaxID=2250595 RepID=A0ABW8J750_9GAMM
MRRRLALAALWLLPLAATAQDSREAYLRQFDTGGKDCVNEAEYVAYMSRGFAQMDRNHDGVLEPDELPGGHGKPVTLQEWQANLRRQFHRLDRHHNGCLDAQELTAPPG